MSIPSDLPKANVSKQEPSQKGDVAREQLAAAEMLDVIVVPRDLKKANQQNGIQRMRETPKKDSFSKYFENVKAKKLPSAGKPHLAAIRTFRESIRASGYSGGMSSHKKHRQI